MDGHKNSEFAFTNQRLPTRFYNMLRTLMEINCGSGIEWYNCDGIGTIYHAQMILTYSIYVYRHSCHTGLSRENYC